MAVHYDNLDFHFFRQIESGDWTHKPRGRAPTKLDVELNELGKDIERSERHPYTNGCGYYCVDPGKVRVQ